MLTSLTPGGETTEQSGLGISSLVDTWITFAQRRDRIRKNPQHHDPEVSRDQTLQSGA